MILINKADGDNRARAEESRLEQETALHYTRTPTSLWKTEVGLCSAKTGEGIDRAWNRIEDFYRQLEPKGIIAARRSEQSLEWLGESVQEGLRQRFYQKERVRAELPAVRESVMRGELSVPAATQRLLAAAEEQVTQSMNESPHYDKEN